MVRYKITIDESEATKEEVEEAIDPNCTTITLHGTAKSTGHGTFGDPAIVVQSNNDEDLVAVKLLKGKKYIRHHKTK